jgi:hypothetical protein
VAAFGGLCFGCGYLTGFIVTRNRWRDEMIERGVARYSWQTGSGLALDFMCGVSHSARPLTAICRERGAMD